MTQGSFWQLHGKKVLIIGAVVSLLGAWTFGQLNIKTDVDSYLPEVMPEAASFELITSKAADGQYLYSAANGAGPIGYVTAGEGQGYGGPIIVLVAWTLDGKITNIQVPQHEETPAWYNRLYTAQYFTQYIGREFLDPFTLDEDINAASGATRSSHGVAEGVYEGRLLLAEHLGQPFVGPKQPIQLGAPEIVLLLGLALVVIFRMVPGLRQKRWPRYVMLVYGLVFFGIWLSAMLSLINFLVFPIGFAPSPATNPLLYVMVFGILGLAAIFGKNFWCFWVCPYCALQEGAHFLGGSQVRPISRRQLLLRNTRYIILWALVMFVFISRQPQISVIEPWNTVFSLEGNLSQWLLVIATLGVSLFIYDFWCHFLCPVGATMDIVLKIRTWTVNAIGRFTAR
ncbi:4Fe-4S binding domain/FMN-binding domain [Dehalogenimonas alkenigignens]|uniref:4Fe-4S binding domain/FMN-binding domain n=1 Tax=Dehalogenimonas alkenigignens TaxID=1217799 RepID=A0A0W0GGG0_9CHLR|nr:FMN-binding protein [Dehalogenimonas alkenigignens]KTB47646.1 4Fe-4S binding domain/FMN-binding domain [Dehalogenimonas alkenigignens]